MADQKRALFEQIDETMFGQVEKVSSNPVMAKYQEFLAAQDESAQKIINQSLSLILTFFPIVIALLIMASNCSLKGEIDNTKSILMKIDTYLVRQTEADSIGRNLIAAGAINSIADIQNKIRTAVERDGLSFSKLTVTNFLSTKTTDTLMDNRADVSFTALTMAELTTLFTAILQKEKMKIIKVDIQKDVPTNLLKGTLGIVSFSKAPSK
jgi:hypothetical protein